MFRLPVRFLPLALIAACGPLAVASDPGPAMTASATQTDACDAAARYSENLGGVALIIQVDGRVVCERYASGRETTSPARRGRLRQRLGRGSPDTATAVGPVGPTTVLPLYSGTKSFTGMVAAAAVADGLITLDERISDTVREWRSDDRLSRVTVRQLISLTSGLKNGPLGSGDRLGFETALIEAESERDPGERFAYGPTAFQVFGGFLSRKLAASGRPETYSAYLQRRVLGPAGVTAAFALAGSDPNLGGGASVSPRDWARYGEWVRSGAGATAVDSAAFEAQFTGSMANPGYGLGWWLARPVPQALADQLGRVADSVDIYEAARAGETPPDLALAAGFADQRLYVSRQARLVIVRLTAGDRQRALQSAIQPGGSGWSDRAFLAFALAAAKVTRETAGPTDGSVSTR